MLQACVGSWSLATALFLTLPAAVAGGALVAIRFGGSLSLGVLLGLVAVLGIAVRNGLALIKSLSTSGNAPDDRRRLTAMGPATFDADAGKTSPH